ncbi:hypothetical protein SAMN02910369_02719 [Lachnospiraceae bacterium NE2001]|nr:hypothetical protein SAMN02910369_02719 [Lachnospiraceae bacterium NE2001]
MINHKDLKKKLFGKDDLANCLLPFNKSHPNFYDFPYKVEIIDSYKTISPSNDISDQYNNCIKKMLSAHFQKTFRLPDKEYSKLISSSMFIEWFNITKAELKTYYESGAEFLPNKYYVDILIKPLLRKKSPLDDSVLENESEIDKIGDVYEYTPSSANFDEYLSTISSEKLYTIYFYSSCLLYYFNYKESSKQLLGLWNEEIASYMNPDTDDYHFFDLLSEVYALANYEDHSEDAEEKQAFYACIMLTWMILASLYYFKSNRDEKNKELLCNLIQNERMRLKHHYENIVQISEESAVKEKINYPFLIIDQDFYNDQRLDTENLAFFKQSFNTINSQPDILFSVVCNDAYINDETYNSIINDINDLSFKNKAPVFIMGNGGSGKSTLLCALSIKAMLGDTFQNVLYYSLSSSSNEKCDKDEFIRELSNYLSHSSGITLLCVDNPSRNPSLIQALYEKKASTTKKSSIFANLRIVFSDRTNSIIDLLSDIEQDYSLWKFNAVPVVISNDTESRIQRISTDLSQIFNKPIAVEKYREDFIKNVLDNTIATLDNNFGLDAEYVDLAKSKLNYIQRTITDLVLDFQREYNYLANSKIKTVPRILWDWDNWKKAFQKITPNINASGIALSEGFKYVAALKAINVPVTPDFIESFFGVSALDAITSINNTNSKYSFMSTNKEGHIEFRHDTIAKNYFEINPKPSPEDCLCIMLKSGHLDSKTIVSISRNLFSLSNLYTKKHYFEPKSILSIISILESSLENTNILKDNYTLHKLDFFKIFYNAPETDNIDLLDSYYQKKLGDSFYKLIQSTTYSQSRKLTIWTSYFKFNSWINVHIAEGLLSFLQNDNTYKPISYRLSLLTNSYSTWMKKENYLNICHHAIEVYSYIIKKIDTDDIHSRIYLMKLYTSLEEYDNARKIFQELQETKNKKQVRDLSLSYIRSYEKEAKEIYRKNYKNKKIYKLNKTAKKLYSDLLSSTSKEDEHYNIIIANYAHFEKECKFFSKAHRILSLANTKEGSPNLYRIYVEYGMLYNTYSPKNMYYNINESIKYFEKAKELTESIHNRKTRLSVLKPLAISYILAEAYDESISVWKDILSFNKSDIEARSYKSEAERLKYLKENELLTSIDINQKRRNNTPIPSDEFYTKVSSIKNSMDSRQIKYAITLELFEYIPSSRINQSKLYALECIRGNKPIPHYHLKLLIKYIL